MGKEKQRGRSEEGNSDNDNRNSMREPEALKT
jgi:hypothetical protein